MCIKFTIKYIIKHTSITGRSINSMKSLQTDSKY